MAGEREVTIKISAKDLSTAEFSKVQKGLKGLGDASDAANKKTSSLERGFSSFGKAAPGALKIVTAAAAATGVAIAAIATAVVALGERGTKLAAVSDGFRNLAAAAGESGEQIVQSTSTAVKGLVTDLDIMQAANKALLLGLPITSDSMADLSQSAVVLGKAMGQDAAKSLDDLITALGRSSPLILDNLGLTVKVGEANEAYAKKLGKTSSQLTEAEKKMAFYEAAVAAASAKVEELGGIQLTFGDRLQRTSVFFTNLLDKLSIGIAKSPVFGAALEAVQGALKRAFGSDTEGLVLGIVNLIERAAITAIEFGLAGIDAAAAISRGFGGIKFLVVGLMSVFSGLATTILEVGATVLESAASIPVLGAAYQLQATAARAAADAMAGVNARLKEQTEDAARAALGTGAFGQGLAVVRGALVEVQTAMVNAGTSQRELNVAVGEGTTKVTNLGTAIGTAKDKIPPLIENMEMWKTKGGEIGESIRVLGEDIVLPEFEQMGTSAALFAARHGVAGDLVTATNRRVEEAARRLGIVTREESKKTEEQIVKDLATLVEEYGKYSDEAIEAQKKLDEFRVQSTEETAEAQLSTHEAFGTGASTVFNALGGRYQAFAAAEGAISALLASVKTMATTPWPANIPMAAAAFAAGMAVVAKIKAAVVGFAEGTRGLDFQDFGPASRAVLHGREAVIPQGGGHQLAAEIAGAMKGKGSDSAVVDALRATLREEMAELRDLPRAIQRAVRDGMLLAK